MGGGDIVKFIDNLCMSNFKWHCQWGADWLDWMPIPACYLKAGTKNCISEVYARMPKVKRKSSSTRCRERRWKEKAAAEDNGGTGGNEVLVNPTRTSPGSEVGYSFIKVSKLILGSLTVKKIKKLPAPNTTIKNMVGSDIEHYYTCIGVC